MPSIGKLVPGRRWITVDFEGTPLRVAYRPNVVTPRLQKAVADARETQDIEAGLLDPLCRLIDSWDLTDDADQLIPITSDAIADIPAAILFTILDAIGQDMAPNPQRDGASRNGSSAVSSAPSQTGTSS